MSLFQVREWWATKSERDEEYSFGALVVGNVDNDAAGQGIPRVFFSRARECSC
jgi:hypothetical protein